MNDTKNMNRETGMADIQAKVKAMAEIINPNASSDPLPDNDDYRSRHVAPYAAKNAGAR